MCKYATRLFNGDKQLDAYKASYNADGMTDASCVAEAKKLSANPAVQAYLKRLQDDADYVAQLTVAWVLKLHMQIATGDPNELVESRLECCRYCHGIGHAYQWLDVNEWAMELANVMDKNARIDERNARASKPVDPLPLPTFDGGGGFWGTKPPVDTCPHCFGNGTQRTHMHDTRKLSPGARMLYAGVKQTANGPEIKLRDQDKSLAVLTNYMGLDKKTLEVSGPNGAPLRSISTVTSDPAEAAKLYASIVAGK